MLNNQAPEPRVKSDGSELDVHSIFYTIQGEGPFAGRPAVFIRLAGCNLQCPGCDTEYTQGRRMMPVYAIVAKTYAAYPSDLKYKPLIVITGGEPLRQQIGRLCFDLAFCGYHIQIESNGVFAPDKILIDLLQTDQVTLVVSPKTTRIHPKAAELAHSFKYVLDARSIDPRDGLPIKALEHPASTGVARPPEGFRGEIFLNPFDAKNEQDNALNLSAVVASCLKFGHRAGIQLHKLINVD